MAFQATRLPTDISYGSQGGPGTSTSIIQTDGGGEVRVSRWERSRRIYDLAYGVKSHQQLAIMRAFYEARRGPAEAFLLQDPFDFTTAADGQSAPTFADQHLGIGDGANAVFQLRKRYSSGTSVIDRPITKPVEGTVLVARNGVLVSDTLYSVDYVKGLITFDTPPSNLQIVTAGCEFDTMVRFEKLPDEALLASYDDFSNESVPSIPLVEVVEEVEVPSDFISGGLVDRSIASTYTMSAAVAAVYTLSAAGSDRNVDCPNPIGLPQGRYFTVMNVGAANDLIVRDHTGSSFVTLEPDEAIDIYLGKDGSDTYFWYGI